MRIDVRVYDAAGGPDATSTADIGVKKDEGQIGESAQVQTLTVLTPFVGVYDGFRQAAAPNDFKTNDLYTRLRVRAYQTNAVDDMGQSSNNPQLEAENRRFLQRLFVGKQTTKIFTLKAKVNDTNYDVTIPLFTAGQTSNRDVGEQFDVNTYARLIDPYFLVSPNTTVQLSINAAISEAFTSDAVRIVMNAIIGVSSAAAPNSALLTKLSAPSASKHSEALDIAIGKLSAKRATQEVKSGQDLSTWKNTDKMTFAMNLPNEAKDK
jgi:hypothetical protein